MTSMSNNIVSLTDWKATHQRNQDQPVLWSYYVVEPDPDGGYRLVLVDRKPRLELDPDAR